MKTSFKFLLILSILALAAPALAKPELNINLKAEKDVVETVDGKEVRKTVPAEEIFPGETIAYTLDVSNSGDQPATNVKVTDPVPPETTLLIDTVFGDGAEVTFSIDGGKSFNVPTRLKYRVEKNDGTLEDRIATPDQYTDIQWVIDAVPAGSTRTVGFKALVK